MISDSGWLQSFGGRAGLSYPYTMTADLHGNASNAPQLGGQPASFCSDVADLTSGKIDHARTIGASLNNPNTLVNRDASGNFSAGVMSAALNGNASTATLAGGADTSTNSAQLNGQSASFYTNAVNLTGTVRDTALSTKVPRLSGNNAFGSTRNSFAGRVGVNTPAGSLELDVHGRIRSHTPAPLTFAFAIPPLGRCLLGRPPKDPIITPGRIRSGLLLHVSAGNTSVSFDLALPFEKPNADFVGYVAKLRAFLPIRLAEGNFKHYVLNKAQSGFVKRRVDSSLLADIETKAHTKTEARPRDSRVAGRQRHSRRQPPSLATRGVRRFVNRGQGVI